RRARRPGADQPSGGHFRDDDRGAQRAREFYRRGRPAPPSAGYRDQRLPAHAGGLAHDRAPRLASSRATRSRVARRAAEDSALNGYAAPWWLPGGHLQTLYPSLHPPARVALQRERWETPDGDFIDVDFAGERAASRLLVLFHGLERSEEHTSELQSRFDLVCRLLLEK